MRSTQFKKQKKNNELHGKKKKFMLSMAFVQKVKWYHFLYYDL